MTGSLNVGRLRQVLDGLPADAPVVIRRGLRAYSPVDFLVTNVLAGADPGSPQDGETTLVLFCHGRPMRFPSLPSPETPRAVPEH